MKTAFNFLLVWLFCYSIGFSQLTQIVSTGGLQTSLTTNGYQFAPGLISGSLQSSFLATATLSNRSKNNVVLMFDNKYLADQMWNFSLYKGDTLVWSNARSYALFEDPNYFFPIKIAIGTGRNLTTTAKIPLINSNGIPWPAGEYVLEAILLSDTKIKCSTIISIQSTYENPGTIIGTVRTGGKDLYGNYITSNILYVIVSPSDTSIPLNTYNSWTGWTDNKGLFRTSLMSGTYSIKVYVPNTSIGNYLYSTAPIVWGSTTTIVSPGTITPAIIETKNP